ncbi:hypothetical protein ARMSODRAFT_463091 [Armillaria solidipes]|uniref:Uncharacterized protein n=1 Tax=Armillaria solidipes TaxID=1076256 RepID=A0A2H3B0Q0_9AGAR|nr:hypothetical protein ARMSODRAFT_463091 [Armillaria solidipes]
MLLCFLPTSSVNKDYAQYLRPPTRITKPIRNAGPSCLLPPFSSIYVVHSHRPTSSLTPEFLPRTPSLGRILKILQPLQLLFTLTIPFFIDLLSIINSMKDEYSMR